MTSTTPVTGRSQARLLAGATIGLIGGFTTTFFATSSQFVRPITQEFGWGRAELSVVVVLAMLGSALAAPFAGRLVARFGPRPIVAISGVFLAAGLALLSVAPASTGYFGLVAFLLGVLSVGTTPVALLVAVPRFFDRKLGLALGVVMGVSALGGGALQVTVGGFLVTNGWRSAYLLLAGAALVTIVVAVLIGFPRGAGPEHHDTDQAAASAPGLTVSEALRSWPFRIMLGAMLLASIGPVGITLHLIALMTDRGINPVAAAGAGAAGGLGLALGRLVSGLLLDRVNAVRLTGVILAVSSIGFIMPTALSADAPLALYALSALIGGFAFGAEGDILPFLVRRYAGVRHYAKVLGVALGVYGLGAAIGPVLYGLSYDQLGSYTPVLWASAAALIVAAIVLQAMGPYRYPREQAATADPTPATVS